MSRNQLELAVPNWKWLDSPLRQEVKERLYREKTEAKKGNHRLTIA